MPSGHILRSTLKRLAIQSRPKCAVLLEIGLVLEPLNALGRLLGRLAGLGDWRDRDVRRLSRLSDVSQGALFQEKCDSGTAPARS